MSTEQAFQAQAMHQNELLTKANVIGVGVGERTMRGAGTGETTLVVLVEQKKPLAALAADDIVPSEINGMKVDVLEVGFLRAQQGSRDRFRPVIPGGTSIGHFKVTAGTLGVMVKDRQTGARFLLSNNHVLANSNDAQTGDDILQPAAMDGGSSPADLVARLDRFKALRFVDDPAEEPKPTPTRPPVPDPTPTPTPDPGQPTPDPAASGCLNFLVAVANLFSEISGSQQRVMTVAQAQMASATDEPKGPVLMRGGMRVAAQSANPPTNTLDAALAKPIDPNMFSAEIRNIGMVTGTKQTMIGMRVAKTGRTTDYTEGAVKLLNATVDITYSTSTGPRVARFTGQVIAESMSRGGDSGSLVVDPVDKKAVGLLFAGSDLATIFTPIDVVFNALNVSL